MDFNNRLQLIGQRMKAVALMPLTIPNDYYNFGMVLLILAVLTLNLAKPFWVGPAIVGSVLLCIAYLSQAFALIKKIWTSDISKVLLNSAAGVLIVTPSLILASHAVNNIVGCNPVDFKFSLTLLSLVYGIYVVLILAAVVLLLHFLFSQIKVGMDALRVPAIFVMNILDPPSADARNKKYLKERLASLRSIAAMLLFLFLSITINLFDSNQEFLRKVGMYILLNSDFYPKTKCHNVPKTARVAYLDDDKILVATPVAFKYFEWKFEQRDCH